jgi:hypothetical protein
MARSNEKPAKNRKFPVSKPRDRVRDIGKKAVAKANKPRKY